MTAQSASSEVPEVVQQPKSDSIHPAKVSGSGAASVPLALTGVAPNAPTPGPWTFARRLSASENDKGFNVWADKGKRWIGEVSPINDEHGNASAEGLANARLIAASPALLAALRVYVAYDEYINGKDGDPSSDRLQKARAALSLATKESQA